jgi:hypothetical protein
MQELTVAGKLHAELDTQYARRLFRAVARNQTAAIDRINELRRINDGAYFLIIFGTFERYITERADTAVKLRLSRPYYYQRRAWETLMKGSKFDTTFLNRVRIVIDQGSPEFNLVDKYYKVRNDLAHEGVTTKIFSIPNVVSELKSTTRVMKR